jgi:hypothetical protein
MENVVLHIVMGFYMTAVTAGILILLKELYSYNKI